MKNGKFANSEWVKHTIYREKLMKPNHLKACFIVLALGMVFAVFSGYAGDTKPPSKVDLTPYQSKKPTSRFGHKIHTDLNIKCNQCHHKAKNGNRDVKCIQCHKAETKGKVLGIKEAFHKQCKDCHKKHKDKNAPLKCKECHQ
ncbi:MAG: cytochrome c3 family protein [Myxococcota bacterium]|nr:cytochrome c3 family protein [Myxococcota bacterium]